VAADLDTSGYDADPDTSKATEKHATASDDVYPDTVNYTKGNTPDIAYRTQGQSGGPNSWDNYLDEVEKDGQLDDPADPWGATYPDIAAKHADPGDGAGSADGQDNIQQHNPASGGDQDNGPPDQAGPAEASSELTPSPEQERISSLETEHAETQHQLDRATQKIADLEARNAGLEAENAENREKFGKIEAERAEDRQEISELKAQNADLAARMDRFEQLMARTDKSQPGDANGPDQSADPPDTSQVQGATSPTIAERKASDQGSDTSDAERAWWRRAASSENVGLAGGLVGAAQTMADFTMNATPEGIVTLGATALGLASAMMARAEKKRKGKA